MELFGRYFDAGLARRGYCSEEEYWHDQLALLDMRLLALLAWREQDGREPQLDIDPASRRDCPPAGAKVLRLLGVERAGGSAAAEPAGRAGADVRAQLRRAQGQIMSRLARTEAGGARFALRSVSAAFSLSKLEQFLLVLSAALCREGRYGAIMEALEGENRRFPSLRLAFALYELSDEIGDGERGRLLELRGPFFEYLAEGDSSHRGWASERMFLLSRRVWSFLLEKRCLDPQLERLATVWRGEEALKEPLIRGELVRRICRLVAAYAPEAGAEREPGDGCFVLHLWGEEGNGRRFALKQAARASGCGLLMIDASRLLDAKAAELDLLVRSLKLERRLTRSLVCFVETRFREEGEEEQARPFPDAYDYLLKALAAELPFFIWLSTERASYLTRYPLHFLALESPMLTVGERIALWQAWAETYPLEEGIDLRLCANQYILTARSIREVLLRSDMQRRSAGEAAVSREALLEAVRQQSSNQLGRFATLINAVFTWDDLVIDEEQKRQMQMICDQMRYRSVVGEEWGFHKKTPYGRGICAMFYGSPGTGKTMAVQVMANELGLDLYRIDLSQMVSKYIGETEKNISALFRKARNINALLFFDEADSMFAKRSEVKDSNDRNANAETAHLLQKLEDYSGITILATNYVNNIDDAFKRRIRFMVHFVFPSEAVRLQLWTTILPRQAALEEELDLEFFARSFELAGSNIKEVLTNAAYLAASAHRGLTNADIVEAVRLNFAKYGKVLTAADFGYMGQYLTRKS